MYTRLKVARVDLSEKKVAISIVAIFGNFARNFTGLRCLNERSFLKMKKKK